MFGGVGEADVVCGEGEAEPRRGVEVGGVVECQAGGGEDAPPRRPSTQAR